ncbi:LytTR family DNA-binding domain-containing protein [Chakrabartyella piscis]|uniref:LytR/AlgR family response regulator transcription factor n=1 Tax=Chakrabartyella piscis TaxID=2918914 RepID=UPI0029586844|nr:LytTR family DNA-binding domain-containing protein [Chakrabartyella piscis]
MQTLRIALCEDDKEEQQHVLQVLEKSHFATKIDVFANGEDFLQAFQPYQYDLILMDIFMDGLTGIEVITKVRTMDNHVPVAFITSSMDFTRESYRLDAIKYIEKPATKKSIIDTLQMARMKQLSVEHLEIRIQNSTKIYPLHNILYMEQKGRNLLIYLLGGEVVSANKKLSDVAEQLLGKGFLHCHKSYLVNLAHVRGINRELCLFEMGDGSKVYIRQRGFWEIQKEFEDYLFSTEQEVLHGET